MSSEIAIRVDELCKCYHIFAKPRDRLLQMVLGGRKKYYKEFWALQPTSFEIRKGETVGLIGRNGSGKSTLLQLICGTLNPTSGTIQVNGRVAALLELGSGFNPEFTGRENVYLNATMLGLSKEEIANRFTDIEKFAEIGDFIDQPVKTYSSGMYVRLAFAVVAHVDADILVIDEALAVGDAIFTQKCMRFLRNFQKVGTIIFVSHDIGAVTSLCQEAYWLEKGKLKLNGLPKDISASYLAEIYEVQQGPSASPKSVQSKKFDSHNIVKFNRDSKPRDMRLDYINLTAHRNDIELFSFKEDAASFGKGGAEIDGVDIRDVNGQMLKWVVGGENVILCVHCRANKPIFSPIIGFFIKDRLGQVLFGDNTYLTYKDNPIQIYQEQSFSASFSFAIPILPVGDYSVNVALAEGNQDDHIQHRWIHEAMIFRSVSTSIATGLVGIPMNSIEITVK